jgi:hypothetical protein
MSTNKKMKTADSSSDEEFERVKKYLLECPHVSADHPAIKAAVVAIEKEQQRVDRDRKLQLKFSITKKTTIAINAEPLNLEDSVVVVDSRSSSPPSTSRTEDSNDEMMEWQDVEEKEKEASDGQTSYLGKSLAKQAIETISEYKAKVRSPVAAIAVALHASLRSQHLGFSCTGIPEDESAPKGGFAPPVRELPKTQLLPASWDTKPSKIALRYRKSGTGALVLKVEQGEDQTITVCLQSASSKEPSSQTLVFSLGDHVNLDSWSAALKTAASVSPALHYKSLAFLLTNFCRTFDLGSIDEDMNERAAASLPYVDNTVPVAQSMQQSDFIPARPVEIPSVGASSKQPRFQNELPTTLGEAFPGINPLQRSGDFMGDLAPAGLMDPRVPSAGGRMGGNLLGPNHPMFQGGGMGMGGPGFGPGGLPLGGPGSMQPRFDPIYPEGIDFPNGPNGGGPPGQPGRRLSRPSRSGEPNPDHLPPPNSFSDNMFS